MGKPLANTENEGQEASFITLVFALWEIADEFCLTPEDCAKLATIFDDAGITYSTDE